jgi:hypothetical protein
MFAVYGARIDRQTRALSRKALFGLRKSKIVAHQIHQIGGILTIVDGEGRREPDGFRIFAQQPRTDGVKCSGPGQVVGSGASRALELDEDQIDAADHLRRGSPGKSQQHDAPWIGTLLNEPGDAVGQGRGFAGAGAGNDQQRAGVGQRQTAVLNGAALL